MKWFKRKDKAKNANKVLDTHTNQDFGLHKIQRMMHPCKDSWSTTCSKTCWILGVHRKHFWTDYNRNRCRRLHIEGAIGTLSGNYDFELVEGE